MPQDQEFLLSQSYFNIYCAQQEVLQYGGIEHGLSCGIIGQLLNNLPGDINTDYRHIAKPWPLVAIWLQLYSL
jgi:hypothetical protein